MRLARGATEVRWARGGLLVRVGVRAVLVDVPSGIEEELGDDLALLDAVVLTSGRLRPTSGLLGLFAALEPSRSADRPLPLLVPFGEERGAALADTWSRLWPGRFPVEVDAERAGASRTPIPDLELRTWEVRAGEPHWQQQLVEPVPAVAVRLTTPDLSVALVPSSAPSTSGRRICAGADLAIVEVGVAAWPRSAPGARAWRPTAQQALEATRDAKDAWLVGDDGRWLGDERSD